LCSVAAAEAGRQLEYYTFGKGELKDQILNFVEKTKDCTVGNF
jgi:hypothetical protein